MTQTPDPAGTAATPGAVDALERTAEDHDYFDFGLTAQEMRLPLDQRIAAAIRAMAQQVGLSGDSQRIRGVIEDELNRQAGTWVFDDLAVHGIDVDGKLILDMGAGLGAVSLEAATRKAKPVALEPGAGLRRLAHERLRQAGCRSVLGGSGECLPFPDATFDIVVSVQVLEHVQNPQAYLDEAFRVLRPGGYLWLSCENYLSFRENHYAVFWLPLFPKALAAMYLRLRGRPTGILMRSITYTTPPWVRRMSRRSGFELLEEGQLREHVETSPGAKFRIARRVLGPDRAARWILAFKRARKLFVPGFVQLVRKPAQE